MKFSSKSFRELKELCEAQKKKNVSKRKSIAYQKQKDQEKMKLIELGKQL